MSTSNHVLFCLLYTHTGNDVFAHFLKISDHFPKILEILQKLSEGRTHVSEHLPRFPKFAEDFRGRSVDVSIIHQQNLSKVEGSNTISVKSSISSLGRIWFHINSYDYCIFQLNTCAYI